MIHDNLEAYMNNTEWFRLSKLVGGITETIPLPDQGTWCKTDYATVMGYTLSTSAPVAGVSAGGSDEMRVVRFGEAATTSTTVRVQAHLPATKRYWFEDSGKSGLLCILKARQVITASTPTYDSALGLKVKATFYSPTLTDTGTRDATTKLFTAESDGTGFVTSTYESVIPPALVANTAPGGFRLLPFDLFSGLTTAQKKAIGPFTSVSLTIAPTKTIPANFGLDIAGGWLCYHRHLTPFRWLDSVLRNLS